jgi:serine/threonine protein kinase
MAAAAQILDITEKMPAGWFGKLEPGDTFNGLTVERVVGEGAMASLYLVRDSDGRERVIKLPRHDKNIDPVSVVAFENELRLSPYLADFRYAYMPQVEGGTRRPYLSLDYIRGQDLWTRLREHGACSEAETLALGIKIAHAVSELHQRRIVHLDLKLSNVMLTPEGRYHP